jgi:hypothetical protein
MIALSVINSSFEDVSMTENTKPLEINMEALRQEAARKAQTFEAIGAFIFQFSQLEFTIRVMLSARLKLEEKQFDIVTAPYDFRMLCTVTREILVQQYPDQKSDIQNLFNRCLKLNDDRVRVAHGLWSDDGRAIIARHVTRSSLKAEHFFENPAAIAKLTDTAQSLMAEILFVLGAPKDGQVANLTYWDPLRHD